jgi:hypothetical protein
MARDLLYGEVADFRCDIAALRNYYGSEVRRHPSQPYFDNGANYVGWAITSRDGSIHDAIQHIPRKARGPGTGRQTSLRATLPTKLYKGPMQEVMDLLNASGLEPFRARVMALDEQGFEMNFHRDADKESWRLHVPIITNPGAFFEWQIDGKVMRAHLPADGRAWFVRVDQIHRAVNEGAGHGERVHLLMSLRQVPAPRRFGPERRLLPGVAAQAAV